jgi:hypothetical protein
MYIKNPAKSTSKYFSVFILNIRTVEDQHLCVVVHKYHYRIEYFIMASVEYSIYLFTVCGKIRQTIDAKMRQLF